MGFVSDSSAGNTFTVEVDLHVDGTVDYTLTTVYEPVLQLYMFRQDLNSATIPLTEFDVKLTPVERNAAGERQVGQSTFLSVVEFEEDVPVLVRANATRFHLYGVIDDARIGYGGRYDVEVAVGSPTSAFTSWGQTDNDGAFFLNNRAPQNVGPLDLYVRIRETSTSPNLVSPSRKISYNTNPPSPPPGYQDPDAINLSFNGSTATDFDSPIPFQGPIAVQPWAEAPTAGRPAAASPLVGNAFPDDAIAAGTESNRATDLAFSLNLPGEEEDSWLEFLV